MVKYLDSVEHVVPVLVDGAVLTRRAEGEAVETTK